MLSSLVAFCIKTLYLWVLLSRTHDLDPMVGNSPCRIVDEILLKGVSIKSCGSTLTLLVLILLSKKSPYGSRTPHCPVRVPLDAGLAVPAAFATLQVLSNSR